MATASSSRQAIEELLARRAKVAIPRDQQKLLDGQDSWAVDLQHNTRHGLAQVPGHVLETVKQAYQAKRDGAKGKSDDEQDGTPDAATQPKGSLLSSPERPLPWSPSPDRTRPQRIPLVASFPDGSSPERPAPPSPSPGPLPGRQRPRVGSSVDGESPQAVPMAPPPRPEPRLQHLDNAPSSDQEDLEVTLPQAQARADAPVNRAAARLAPTMTPSEVATTQAADTPPPCAQQSQDIIPCTVATKARPGSKPVASGRKYRYKAIELGDSPIKRALCTATAERMPTTKVFVDISSSHFTWPSSMVPATCQEASTLESAVVSIEPVVDSPAATQQETCQVGTGVEEPAANTTRPHRADQPGLVMNQQRARPRESEHLPPQLNPYEAFAATYPDYVTEHAGSLWNFVRACVCVELLQRDRGLRECLYDDFIRAFSGGYVGYVAKAGPGQEPLPAVEWFNNLQGAALYNRMMVTRGDLEFIFRCFPQEAGRARTAIRGEAKDTAERESARTPRRSPQPQPTLGSSGGDMDVDSSEALPTERPPSRPQTPRTAPRREPPTQPPPRPGSELGALAAATPTSLTRSRLPMEPSPRLGSDSRTLTAAMPTSSTGPEPPTEPPYFGRMASSALRRLPRKRSAEEQARLREHFRRRKVSSNSPPGKL